MRKTFDVVGYVYPVTNVAVRTAYVKQEIWLNLSDVCDCLGISEPKKQAQKLVNNWLMSDVADIPIIKLTIWVSGKPEMVEFINEQGLNELISLNKKEDRAGVIEDRAFSFINSILRDNRCE